MKKTLTLTCILVLVLIIATACISTIDKNDQTVNETDPLEWFANEANYTSHYYGGFGGVTSDSEGSVRILAQTSGTSNGHIGFMLKKEVI